MICTFFGHRDAPEGIQDPLRDVILDLIEQKGMRNFFVGSQGAFDTSVIRILRKLQTSHPHIRITVVLAYRPTYRDAFAVAPMKPSFPNA